MPHNPDENREIVLEYSDNNGMGNYTSLGGYVLSGTYEATYRVAVGETVAEKPTLSVCSGDSLEEQDVIEITLEEGQVLVC